MRSQVSIVGEAAKTASAAIHSGCWDRAATGGDGVMSVARAVGEHRSSTNPGFAKSPVSQGLSRGGGRRRREAIEQAQHLAGHKLTGVKPRFIQRAVQIVAIDPRGAPKGRLGAGLRREGRINRRSVQDSVNVDAAAPAGSFQSDRNVVPLSGLQAARHNSQGLDDGSPDTEKITRPSLKTPTYQPLKSPP